jgi:16S rRNA (uracil1498-N3)-methyltransferase
LNDVRLNDPSVWRLDTFRVAPGCLSDRAVVVDGPEGHHAVDVVRVRGGELVRLIDGEGTEAVARVESVERSVAQARVLESRTRERADGVQLTVAQALLKGRSFDEVVRRCAELGVAGIVPTVTERTIGRVPGKAEVSRRERWKSVALAATKQSRGVFVPRIGDVLSLGDVTSRIGEHALSLVAWEEESGEGLRQALAGERPSSILLVVGPEGGLSEGEVAALSSGGAVAVSAGERVLRADWAAAAIAGMIAYEVGGLLP